MRNSPDVIVLSIKDDAHENLASFSRLLWSVSTRTTRHRQTINLRARRTTRMVLGFHMTVPSFAAKFYVFRADCEENDDSRSGGGGGGQ
jgi:hypothetical protein